MVRSHLVLVILQSLFSILPSSRDASDKVVQGNEKFEALMVCSSEIAASTAQLVAASRVKSDKESINLKELQTASKGVAASTAKVVASAKTGAEMIDEKGEWVKSL